MRAEERALVSVNGQSRILLYAQDRPHPLVASAVQAIQREGLVLREFTQPGTELLCRWARALAQCVARGECSGGVIFCQECTAKGLAKEQPAT